MARKPPRSNGDALGQINAAELVAIGAAAENVLNEEADRLLVERGDTWLLALALSVERRNWLKKPIPDVLNTLLNRPRPGQRKKYGEALFLKIEEQTTRPKNPKTQRQACRDLCKGKSPRGLARAYQRWRTKRRKIVRQNLRGAAR